MKVLMDLGLFANIPKVDMGTLKVLCEESGSWGIEPDDPAAFWPLGVGLKGNEIVYGQVRRSSDSIIPFCPEVVGQIPAQFQRLFEELVVLPLIEHPRSGAKDSYRFTVNCSTTTLFFTSAQERQTYCNRVTDLLEAIRVPSLV